MSPDELSEGMEDMMQSSPISISFSDILMVALLLASCYVFGKIWKGCTYLIIVMALLYFFWMR